MEVSFRSQYFAILSAKKAPLSVVDHGRFHLRNLPCSHPLVLKLKGCYVYSHLQTPDALDKTLRFYSMYGRLPLLAGSS